MRLARRAAPLSARQFFDEHVRSSRPVLLQGLCPAGGADSPWSVDALRRRLGARRVPVEVPHTRNIFGDPGRHGVQYEWTTVGAYLDQLARQPAGAARRYLAQIDLARAFPELLADVPRPACLAPVYCAKTALWIGPGDQVTPCHHDVYDNVVFMLQGRKTWTLHAPADSARLYPRDLPAFNYSHVDVEQPDLARFPEYARARPIVVELHAGEALYVPSGWWHHVRGHGLNIAVNSMWSPPVLPASLRSPAR